MSILFVVSWYKNPRLTNLTSYRVFFKRFWVSSWKISLVQYEVMRLGSYEESKSIHLTLIASILADTITIHTRLILELEVSCWSSTHYRNTLIQPKVSCEDARDERTIQNKDSSVAKPSSLQPRCPPPVAASSVCCLLPLLWVVCLNQWRIAWMF